MKKFLLSTVALIALGATVPALQPIWRRSASTPRRRPIAAPIYNWTGFYIGGHVGGAFGGNDDFNGLVGGNNNDGRLLGGVQAGADYQFAPNWVVGVEGQYAWLGGNNDDVVFPATAMPTPTTSAVSARYRPRRLHLGSGAALRQRRLRLFRQPRDADVRRRSDRLRLRP